MDYQKVILVGNASTDAKSLKSKKGDIPFMAFSIGVKNGKGHTSFFPVVVFGKLGDSLASYVTKGRFVLVEGRIEVSNTGRFNVIADRVVLGASPQGTKPKEGIKETK